MVSVVDWIGGRMASCMSCFERVSPEDHKTARLNVFKSSRTLPGQVCLGVYSLQKQKVSYVGAWGLLRFPD